MNTEKKLEYFTQAIAKEVESKKRQERQRLAAQLAEAVQAAQAQAETKAKEQIAACRQAIQKICNRRITEARTQARSSLATLRQSLTAQLFDDIKAHVTSYTHSHEYENYLIENIQSALAKSKHSFTYVQLSPGDMRLASVIHDATRLTPELGEDGDIGGFRLLSANRGIAAEYRFRYRLASVMEAFSMELIKYIY